jgi:hypothetical protein
MPEHRLRSGDQEAAQIGVAHFGDASEPLMPTRGALARDQAEPGRELAWKRKLWESTMIAARAVAVIGLMPGILSRRRTAASASGRRRISRSSSAISSSSA